MHRRRSQGSGHPLLPARRVPKGKLGRAGRLARALSCLRPPFVSTWPRPFHPMSTWPALHPLGLITNVTFSSVTADLQHGKGGSLPSLGPHCTPPRGPCSPVQAIWIQYFCLSLPPAGETGVWGDRASAPTEKLVSMKSASTPAATLSPPSPAHSGLFGGVRLTLLSPAPPAQNVRSKWPPPLPSITWGRD